MFIACRNLAALSLLSLLAGCAGLPSYGVNVTSPNKDTVRLEIILEKEASPEIYQTIALRELERIHTQRGRDREINLPLYEASFDFHITSPRWKRLARVRVQFQSDQARQGGISPASFTQPIPSNTPTTLSKDASPPRIQTTIY